LTPRPRSRHNEVEARLFARLTAAEQQQLASLLGKLIDTPTVSTTARALPSEPPVEVFPMTSTSTISTTKTLFHWAGGQKLDGKSGRFSDVTNPATGEVTASLPLASEEEAAEVIAAAKAAFPKWRDTSLAKRTRILFKFRELLDERASELAAIITSEHGKVLSDAAGEVARGQEVVEFAAPHLLKGSATENASTDVDVDVESIRQPLGVVGIISPFNFPAMVPMWFFPVAIAAGNTVVVKPSEKVPTAALWIAELWREAGLLDGVFSVFSVLNGDKTAVDALLTSPDVKAISFVGSTPIAQYVYETGTAHGKRVQALGGAKNHMVVLPDADLDVAADQAINAGFGSAGERCMAISALVAGGEHRRRAGWRRSRNVRSRCAPVTGAGAATWARW
jgi:malonate-semialdehyde dehydrogenase (acetylating)/methylmalonate-semialdehyde dehydrogenase